MLDSEDLLAAQALKPQLDEYLQTGKAMLDDSSIDETNMLTKILPVKRMGAEVLAAAEDYRAKAQTAIATKLDRLGLVGLTCLIITAVFGAAAVIGGLIISTRVPRTIGRTLNEAATGISSSAAELMAVASQVAASAAQTAASTNETTVTVEEVKQTAMLANEKAGQVVESVGTGL